MTIEIRSTLEKYKSLKVVAKSSDNRAGIITYDKYWLEDGHRSTYLSFEPVSLQGDAAEQILKESIEWTRNWEQIDFKEEISDKTEDRETDEEQICILFWCF